MDETHALIRERKRKTEELRARGIDPYPNDFRVSHAIDALPRAGLSGEPGEGAAHYRVAGRVMAIRRFGKAAFVRLQDRSGAYQAHLRFDLLGDAFQLLDFLDVGDFLGASGPCFLTRTQEPTLQAREVKILAKSHRPLPEKWHGLTDLEARYRQRYVDLIVNPPVREAFRTRARIVQYLRRFFDARGFLEVETPMLHAIYGGAAARPFVTHHNTLDLDLYLRIAPELHLKRLVVGGLERVYELNRNFRNEGISTIHNPEFTMMEFYMAYATYLDLMDLTEELLRGLATEVAGSAAVRYQGREIDFGQPFRRVSVEQGIREWAEAPPTVIEERAAAIDYLDRRGWPADPKASHGKLLMEIFERSAEAHLVQPTFVTDFPIEVSPLARKKTADPRYVDRFELFVAGREIANAFSELNDPDDQQARFEAQVRERAQGDEEAMPYDEDYVRALEHGMPPAAGEGIGIDRLTMLLTDAASIRDVILFPLLRPERESPPPAAKTEGE